MRFKYKFKIISCISVIVAGLFLYFVHKTHAAPQPYYFNNAVNTSPLTLGNYWRDEDLTDPALSLPDLNAGHILIVVTGATYAGNAIFNESGVNYGTVSGDATFNDSSINEGLVTGNAIFYGDDSGNGDGGTVSGTKTRYYNGTLETGRDFVSDGPWIVIADGGVVNVSGATYNGSTTFTTLNGGSFVYVVISSATRTTSAIAITFNKALDSGSVPSAGDFDVFVDGVEVTVSNVAIVGAVVTLTLPSATYPSSVVTASYTPGVNPIRDSFQKNALAIDADELDLRMVITLPTGARPGYGTLVNGKIYVPNRLTPNISVIDPETESIVSTITFNPVDTSVAFIIAVSNKLYVNLANKSKIAVVDTSTDTVTSTIDLPVGVSATSDAWIVVGDKVYVATNGGASSSAIYVIDSVTDTIVDSFHEGDGPYALSLVGTKLYATNNVVDDVASIDTLTNTLLDNITAGNQPYYMTAVGTKLYEGNNLGDDITVIDTTNDTVVETIPLPAGSFSQQPVTVGTKVYMPSQGTSIVTIIDSVTDDILTNLSISGIQFPVYPFLLNSHIYMPRLMDDKVDVIDTDTDTVIDTIDVGDVPQSLIQYENKLFVMNSLSGTVSVINTEIIPSQLPNLVSISSSSASNTYTTGETIAITATFGRNLLAGSTMKLHFNTGSTLTLSTVSGNTLTGTYTVKSSDATPDFSVASISNVSVTDSTSTYTRTSYDLPSSVGSFEAENSLITRNIGDAKNIQIGNYKTIEVGDNPYQISAEVNGYIYVANQGSDDVSVVQISDNTVVATINVGDEPYGLTVAGTEIYVANINSNTVSVIDTSNNTVTHTIPVGVKPYYAATIGTKVYVTNGASNTVSVINTATHAVTATISVGSYPRGIKAHGTDLYVANYGDPNYSGGNYISVINSLTNTVSDTIVLPAGSTGPRGVTVLNDKVYVANYRSHNVTVIDTVDNSIEATIAVGNGPRGIAGIGTQLYVENFDDGTISIINTLTNTVTDTIPVGHSPSGVTVIGSDLYISSFQDNVLRILDTSTDELEVVQTIGAGGGSGGGSAGGAILPSMLAQLNPIQTNTSAPGGPTVIFTKNLKLNTKDNEVLQLQKYLNVHGFNVSNSGAGSKGKESTIFGLKTKAALIKFQKVNKLQPDGVVGPKTRGFLNTHP